jgi:hypothetical protein
MRARGVVVVVLQEVQAAASRENWVQPVSAVTVRSHGQQPVRRGRQINRAQRSSLPRAPLGRQLGGGRGCKVCR